VISVLVPTVDEAGNIDELLDRIHGAVECEVIVIDGESKDGTQEKVAARGDAKLVVQKGRQGGLTGAVLLGAKEASHDQVVVIDADLSHPPEVLPEMVALLEDHDVVVASRNIEGGGAPDWPLRRRFTSWVASCLAWPLTDSTDPMSGYFATHKDLLLEVDPEAKGFKVGLEVLTRADGDLRVAEVPIVFHDRTGGESKLGANVIRAYLDRLFALAGGNALPVWAAIAGAAVDFALMSLDPGLSAAVGWTLAYLLGRRYRLKDRMTEGRRIFRAITVAVLALFFRNGFLALGWGNVVAALAGGALIHLGNCFYVFPRPQMPGTRRIRWRVGAIALVVYSVLLRLLYAGAVDVMPEEAYYWSYAQHPAPGYLDHPPMVAWLIGLGTGIFGDNPFGVRVFSHLCWAVFALYSYRLARETFSKTHGILALAFVATLPFFMSSGFAMLPDAPLTACWAAAIYYLKRVFVDQQRSGWWGAGIAIGIGMLSKYSIVFLGPAILALMLLDRKWWLRLEPYGAGVLALLIFSPVIWWNVQHDWASFAFQSTRRVNEPFDPSWHRQLLAILAMLTPVGVRALFLGFRKTDHRRYFAALIFVPLGIILFFSVTKWTKANWTGPIWLAAVPLLAATVLLSATWSRRWGATLSVTLCIMAGILQGLSLGFPGLKYPDRLRTPVGWQEMSDEIARVERTLDNPVIVGMDRYYTVSQLSFHDPAREVAGRHLFGKDALMWAYWSDPAQFIGRDMLLVGLLEIEFERLEAHFAELGPVEVVRLGHKGRFVYRIARGYRR
jgi:dolichol-phosphate mannosyltransferase